MGCLLTTKPFSVTVADFHSAPDFFPVLCGPVNGKSILWPNKMNPGGLQRTNFQEGLIVAAMTCFEKLSDHGIIGVKKPVKWGWNSGWFFPVPLLPRADHDNFSALFLKRLLKRNRDDKAPIKVAPVVDQDLAPVKKRHGAAGAEGLVNVVLSAIEVDHLSRNEVSGGNEEKGRRVPDLFDVERDVVQADLVDQIIDIHHVFFAEQV